MCAKMECELSDMDDNEKKEMLQEFGIESTGLEQLIQATYDLLGLETFFTVGKDEVRAWTYN